MKHTRSVEIDKVITTLEWVFGMVINPNLYLLILDKSLFTILAFSTFQNLNVSGFWTGLLEHKVWISNSFWGLSIHHHEMVQKPLQLVLGKGENSRNGNFLNQKVYSRTSRNFPHTSNLTIYLNNLTIHIYLFQVRNESIIHESFSFNLRHLNIFLFNQIFKIIH